MSMISVFREKKTGKKDTFITSQYELGLYVAIYHEGVSIPSQTTSNLKELAFHKRLRANYNKRKATFVSEGSSPLDD